MPDQSVFFFFLMFVNSFLRRSWYFISVFLWYSKHWLKYKTALDLIWALFFLIIDPIKLIVFEYFLLFWFKSCLSFFQWCLRLNYWVKQYICLIDYYWKKLFLEIFRKHLRLGNLKAFIFARSIKDFRYRNCVKEFSILSSSSLKNLELQIFRVLR